MGPKSDRTSVLMKRRKFGHRHTWKEHHVLMETDTGDNASSSEGFPRTIDNYKKLGKSRERSLLEPSVSMTLITS